MAAPTACMRVRLDLNALPNSDAPRLIWYLVRAERLDTIAELGAEIATRFNLSSTPQLSLDGCLVPSWEVIGILRENDLITVSVDAPLLDASKTVAKKLKKEEKRDIESVKVEPVFHQLGTTLSENGMDEATVSRKKKRKGKHSKANSVGLCLDAEQLTAHDDLHLQCNGSVSSPKEEVVENEECKEKKRKKRKRKKHQSESEEDCAEGGDAFSPTQLPMSSSGSHARESKGTQNKGWNECNNFESSCVGSERKLKVTEVDSCSVSEACVNKKHKKQKKRRTENPSHSNEELVTFESTNDANGHDVSRKAQGGERSKKVNFDLSGVEDVEKEVKESGEQLNGSAEAHAENTASGDSIGATVASTGSEDDDDDDSDDKETKSSHLRNERLRKKRKRTKKRLKKRAAKSLKKYTNGSLNTNAALNSYPASAFVRIGSNKIAAMSNDMTSIPASNEMDKNASNNARNSNISFALNDNSSKVTSLSHVTNNGAFHRKDTPRPPLYLERHTYGLDSKHLLFNSDSEGDDNDKLKAALFRADVCDRQSKVKELNCNNSNGADLSCQTNIVENPIDRVAFSSSDNRVGESRSHVSEDIPGSTNEDMLSMNAATILNGTREYLTGIFVSHPTEPGQQASNANTSSSIGIKAISGSLLRKGQHEVEEGDGLFGSMASMDSIQQRMQYMSECKARPDTQVFEGRYGGKKRGGHNPFADVQVFSRQRLKKAPSVPLSREEQLRSVQTNRSIILQNGVQSGEPVSAAPVVQRDYSKCAPLVGPPRPGDLLAYKVLEMSADYQPVISEYKEARVISYDHSSGCVALDIVRLNQLDRKTPGRFDVSIEDENEIFTNVATNEDKQAVLQWNQALEPRLIIDVISGN